MGTTRLEENIFMNESAGFSVYFAGQNSQYSMRTRKSIENLILLDNCFVDFDTPLGIGVSKPQQNLQSSGILIKGNHFVNGAEMILPPNGVTKQVNSRLDKESQEITVRKKMAFRLIKMPQIQQ